MSSPTASRLSTVSAAGDNPPWWREGMVWMVILGPLLVVVAGVATAVIAIQGADPVLPTRPALQGPAATAPALQGRNHAATPAPVPAPVRSAEGTR